MQVYVFLPNRGKVFILLKNKAGMVRSERYYKSYEQLGATKEEIIEMIATAVFSSGAPAIITGPEALKRQTDMQ